MVLLTMDAPVLPSTLFFFVSFFFFNDTATTEIYTLSLIDTLFFFNDTATTEIYTLSLHDALPISVIKVRSWRKRNQPIMIPNPAQRPPNKTPLSFPRFCVQSLAAREQARARRRASHV